MYIFDYSVIKKELKQVLTKFNDRYTGSRKAI